MIDHVLGRPSVTFRKTQVFAVVLFWSLYLLRGNNHGPPGLREISSRLTKRLTPWQTLVITLLWLYISRNFAKIVGLECPEPLANLYTRSYFRATWVTTALDAGFWTAMKIKRRWLRDLASVVFSIYYLIAAEQADEKVRKVRATLTVEHLRVSWNKGTTPYLHTLTSMLRPKLSRYPPKKLRIPRPPESAYNEPVEAWLYYDGPFSTISKHTNIVLDVPGGGFVAMDPRNHDDRLLAWCGKTGIPILSLDYKKAPEYPYPYALNECYDVYSTLMASNGRCIGLSGEVQPSIVLSGDSAGGNLATGAMIMILQSAGFGSRRREVSLPVPKGLVLVYPGLDMNIGSWMTDEQMSLIQDRRTRATNKNILRRKSEEYYKLDPSTPHPSDDEATVTASPPPLSRAESSSAVFSDDPLTPETEPPSHRNSAVAAQQAEIVDSKPQIMKTRLAMSSMISYFNDRILTPEMMRAMIILYVGPHNRPDFTTDYLLSPLLCPEAMLAEFPKVFFMTGERDPLVDDTVIFAGRLRQAKYNQFVHRKEVGLVKASSEFDEKEHLEVTLIPGISHGFIQFVSLFPEGWKHIFRCARWIESLFNLDELDAGHASSFALYATNNSNSSTTKQQYQQQPGSPHPLKSNGTYSHDGNGKHRARHHFRSPTDSSGDEDRPLEMTALTGSVGSVKSSSSPSHHNHNHNHHNHNNHHHHHHHGGDGRNGKAKRSRAGTGVARGAEEREREREKAKPKRTRSSVSLASEDDLLGRRMKGLAGGLMGMTPVD